MMGKFNNLFFVLLFISILSAVTTPGQSIKKLTANVETQQVSNGYSSELKATLFYTANGNLVSHITYPREYIMMVDNIGEMKIYDPVKNTVTLLQNFLFSTSSMQLHYFLDGLTNDLGLKQAGYNIENVKFENNLSITTWKSNNETDNNPVSEATLVKRNDTLIYMDYRNRQGMIIRKLFFYHYTSLDDVLFPRTITEILYHGNDSTVTRTEYTSFLLNDKATGNYFNYKIPLNAKLTQ
jgi:hypothetical protein